jgi:RNA polymerase sigma factor (sigma-70 family)
MDLSEEGDEEILIYLAAGDADQKNAAAAQFFVRFHPYLLTRCARYCREMGFTRSDPEDFAIDVLMIAIEKAETFRAPSCSSPSAVTNHIKAWIGKIAMTYVADAIRDMNGYTIADDCESTDEKIAIEEDAPPPNRSIPYRKALAQLPEEERNLLQAYYGDRSLHNPEGRGQQGVTQALAQKLGLTPPALRKRIERIKKKLQLAVSGTS